MLPLFEEQRIFYFEKKHFQKYGEKYKIDDVRVFILLVSTEL